MASPPFDIAQTVPGDSDIVSQYPTAERSFRDIVESWLLIDHNTSGQHAQVTLGRLGTMPTAAACVFAAGTDPTVAANLTVLYAKADGALYIRSAEQGIVPIGNVPVGGTMVYAGASEPVGGWKFCNGQVLACASFPALFGIIGATYNTGGEGAGNFRVPDLRGRIVGGWEGMGSVAGRITVAGSGVNGFTLAASGGSETFGITLAAANIPLLTGGFASGGKSAAHTHATTQLFATASIDSGGGGPNYTAYVTNGGSAITLSAEPQDHTHTTTVTFGSGSPTVITKPNVPHILIMSYIIKT